MIYGSVDKVGASTRELERALSGCVDFGKKLRIVVVDVDW